MQGTCRIDRNQAQLRKAKSCSKNTSVKAGKSQSDSCNIPEILKAITANLEEVNAMLYDLKEANNKTVETYTCVVSEPGSSNKKDYGIRKRKFKVIPWFCIAHPLLRITLRHPIWRKRKLPARLATTKGTFAGAYPCTKQVEEKT